MASKAKIVDRTDPTQPETAVEEREGFLHSTREQEIRNRAYEIYVQAAGNLAMNWRIGFRLNVNSLRTNRLHFSVRKCHFGDSAFSIPHGKKG